MPTLVKTFSLILQQEREFKTTFHSNSQDYIVNLAFPEEHGKNFCGGFFDNHGRGALLGLVAAIPNIVTIVTGPIMPLIPVGLSTTCLKALTYTLKSNLFLPSPLLVLVWLISSPLLPIFVSGRIMKLLSPSSNTPYPIHSFVSYDNYSFDHTVFCHNIST